jgi:hypothetical protein
VKPVVHPLKLQMKRPEVHTLHQALSFLGLTILEKEKNLYENVKLQAGPRR